MKISVFGDVMWNYQMTLHPSLPVECNVKQVGGTLLNMAAAAKKYFDTVIAVGSIGLPDDLLVHDRFSEAGIIARLTSIQNVSTGACVLTYNNGLRTGITSFRQANLCLPFTAIPMEDVVTSDFIFVNGWSFLPKSLTSKAILQVVYNASERRIPVIFDILPHQIQKSEMTDDYLAALELSSIVICETQGRDSSARSLDLAALRTPLMRAKLFIMFDWVSRFRVVTDDDRCLADEFTNYSKDADIGFLDAIALEQVLKYYKQSST